MGVNVRFDVDRLKGLSRCKAGGGAAAAAAAAWRKTRGPGPRPGAGRSTQDDVFCGANLIVGGLWHESDYCFPLVPPGAALDQMMFNRNLNIDQAHGAPN